MGTGIIVCGLNGAGKSTLGKALAGRLSYHFIDNEDLYFPGADPDYIYAAPRTREEVKRLLWGELKAHENFVFASVTGDYGKAVYPFFRYRRITFSMLAHSFGPLMVLLYAIFPSNQGDCCKFSQNFCPDAPFCPYRRPFPRATSIK